MATDKIRETGSKDKPIQVKSFIKVSKSPDLEEVTHKAVAGMTPEEVMAQNTIGELDEKEEESEESGE